MADLSFDHDSDFYHILRLLAAGQITAARGAELMREIQAGGSPYMPPYEDDELLIPGEPAAAEPAERGEPAAPRPPILPLSCLEPPASGEGGPTTKPWPETVRDWLDSMASGLDTAGAASEAMRFEGWAEQVREQPTTETAVDALVSVAHWLGQGNDDLLDTVKGYLCDARDQAERRWREEVNLPPASGEPAEPPADWRDAVEDVVSREMPCTPQCSEVRSATGRKHLSSCPAGDVDHLVLAFCSALAPLVLGEKLRAERLRRAIGRALGAKEDRRRHILGDALLSGSPPSTALAELVGLPAWIEAQSRLFPAHWPAFAAVRGRLRAVLAKLGLPAGDTKS